MKEQYKLTLKTEKLRIGTDEITNKSITTENINGLEITSYERAGGINIDNTSVLYENQIVKYGIKVKNTSSNKISNIKIEGLVPEGATLVELIKDNYLEPESEYFDKLEDKSVVKEFELEAGATYTLEYNVKINNIENDTSEIVQYFNIYTNNQKIKTIENKNIVKKALIEVTMMDGTDSRIQPTVGHYTIYALKIKNLTNNNLQNINIKPIVVGNVNTECIICEEDLEESLKQINLSEYETKVLFVYVFNNGITDENSLSENFNVSAICSVNNEIYYSNGITKNIINDKTSISANLSSNINAESVYDGTEIVYNIKVTNTGLLDTVANINYNMPYGLKITRVIIKRDNKDNRYSEGESELELSNVEIKAKESLDIEVYTKVLKLVKMKMVKLHMKFLVMM